jgi:MFS family permease
MLGIVLFVDPAFFYPRLSADPLNYVLKAQHFLENGNLDARWAVNLRPFPYVSMPGVLRLPAIAGFNEFDHQLRAMQILNIPMVAAVAGMSAYIFSWVLPRSRHALAVAFAFAFTLISPVWLANVFLPLADAPYAAFTLAALLVAIELLCSDRPISSRRGLAATFIVLFVVSFLLRFTAPVLLLFVASLGYSRWRSRQHSPRMFLVAGGIAVAAIVALVFLNSDAIFGRYFQEPISFMKRGEKPGMLLNLFGAALPTQIIPTFQLGFVHPPIVDTFSTSFSSSVLDLAWAAVGCVIAALIVAGMWFTRRTLLPEILYVLGALPILTLMMPSTTRYLMPYQAFFWVFFYSGVAILAGRYAPWLTRLAQSKRLIISTAVGFVVLVIGLRVWKTAGTASERFHVVTVTGVSDYVDEVSGTFRALRNYLERLPRERTLLVGGRGTVGRWKAISGYDYIHPDSTFMDVTRNRDTYLIVECGTLDACLAWDIYKTRAADRLKSVAAVELDSVFAAGSGRARAQVMRVRAIN